jgi:transcriptional regulator with XRE-family HTH domain
MFFCLPLKPTLTLWRENYRYAMEPKNEEFEKARNLFLQTDFTQQEIASLLGIDRKTLYRWIKEHGWSRARYAAAHAPSVLVEQYYEQLGEINRTIASRADHPYPTKEESETIRRLASTIKTMRSGKQTASETMDVFTLFTDRLIRENRELTKTIMPYLDKHVKTLTEDGKLLHYSSIRQREEAFDSEYEQWLQEHEAQQENGASNGATNAPDTPATSAAGADDTSKDNLKKSDENGATDNGSGFPVAA